MKRWTFADVQKLFDMVERGMTHAKIAEELGRSEAAISQMRWYAKRWVLLQQPADVEKCVIQELPQTMVVKERPVWGIAASAVLGICLGLVMAWGI